MKTRYRLLIVFGAVLILSAFLAITASGHAPAESGSGYTPSIKPMDSSATAALKEMTVLIGAEPGTLYSYGGSSIAQSHVLQALLDGPIDIIDFAYDPVILESIPLVDNGGAITRAVTVNSGDYVVNDSGEVIALATGDIIRPVGCYASGCAISYAGTPVQMEQWVVTFTLKSNLKWSDGAALTADDSVYGFELAADAATPTGHTKTDRTLSYTAPNTSTTVWTGLPGYVDDTFFLNFWTPFPRHQLETTLGYTALDLLTAPESTRGPLGWGPFRITEWVAGSHITVEKNPYYWRASEGLPYLDAITFRFASGETSDALSQLITGEAQIATSDTGLDDYTRLLLNLEGEGVLKPVFTSGTVWEHLDFGINSTDSYTRPDFFEDVRVRQAIAYCLDRQSVVDTLLYGRAVVLDSYIPNTHPLYPASGMTVYAYDPPQGQALLEAAGWRDDDLDGTREAHGVPGIADGTPLEFKWQSTTSAQRIQYMQLFQQDLAGCGIKVNLENMDSGQFFADGPDGPVFGRKFDLASFAWVTGVRPPCELYLGTEIPAPDNSWRGQNNPGFMNAAYDTACTQALRASYGSSAYVEGHQEAQRILSAQLPVIPLYMRYKLGVTRPEVKGFVADPISSEVWNSEVWDLETPAPAPPATRDTITVCMGQEPGTLYSYGGSMLAESHILNAVKDGPFTNLSYEYQPVILEKLPTLYNGGAVLHRVTVSTGDWVVDSDGNNTPLSAGTRVNPPGCYGSACAVTFDGTPIEMEQLVVTFKIKAGISWSDGIALSADDSVYSYEIAADPATSINKYVIDRTASYVASDNRTTIWTGLPGHIGSTYFLNFWTPYPRHQLETTLGYTPADLLSAPESTRTPLGWGPFRITEWVAGDHISVERNPFYWREGYPLLSAITFKFVDNSGTALAMLVSGGCDITTQDLPLTDYAELLLDLESAGALKPTFTPGTVWEHVDFGINSADTYTRPDFFGDTRTRQAIAYCMDRQDVVDTLLYGRTHVIDVYLPPEHPLYAGAALTLYPYNPTQGQTLLDAVGWRDDDHDGTREAHGVAGIADGTPLEFKWQSTTTSLRVQYMQMFQQDLAECGIKVNLEHIDSGQFFANGPYGPVFGRMFDLASFAWLTGVEPPCDLYLGTAMPAPYNNWVGQNNPGFMNTAYDAACQMARGSLPGSAQYIQGHKDAQRIFTEQLPVLPLFSRQKLAVTRPEVSHFQMDPTENSETWNAWEWDLTQQVQVEPLTTANLTASGGSVQFTFPAGTFSETTLVTYEPLLPPETGGMLVPTRLSYAITGTTQVQAAAAALASQGPYSVTLTYSSAEIQLALIRESSLALYSWDGVQWVAEPTFTLDMDHNTISATPDHFSQWAVLGETFRLYTPIVLRNH